jgi:hypothetical protein
MNDNLKNYLIELRKILPDLMKQDVTDDFATQDRCPFCDIYSGQYENGLPKTIVHKQDCLGYNLLSELLKEGF